MKRYSHLLSIPLAAVLWGLAYLATYATVTAQTMDGDNMKGMREMMQRMMGDVLPPGIGPALLPAPAFRAAQEVPAPTVMAARICGGYPMPAVASWSPAFPPRFRHPRILL